jgi:hypothetical protein
VVVPGTSATKAPAAVSFQIRGEAVELVSAAEPDHPLMEEYDFRNAQPDVTPSISRRIPKLSLPGTFLGEAFGNGRARSVSSSCPGAGKHPDGREVARLHKNRRVLCTNGVWSCRSISSSDFNIPDDRIA